MSGPYLVIERRGQFLVQVPLREDRPTTVGSKGADFTVADARVAPIQAAVACEGDEWHLEDRSGRGTLVDEKEVARAPLRNGSVIGFGDTEAIFSLRGMEGPERRRLDETKPLRYLEGDPLPAELIVVAEIPGQPQTRRELRLGKLDIGSAVDAGELRLEGDGISALHARITRLRRKLMFHDPLSRYGSFCPTGRLYEAALRLGARVQIGPYEVWVQEPEAAAERPDTGKPEPRLFRGMWSADPRMHKLFADLARQAPIAHRALIHGESGTGKELVARALHDLSGRKGPFVAENCANFDGDLVLSMLFGHKKGAFTGATSDQPGAFARAEGGTLFLDELAELPLPAQAKLLRVLDTRVMRPLGGSEEVPVNVRIVGASHKSLPAEIKAGRFRLDLYHRLAAATFELPALRDRLGDVPLLWGKLGVEQSPVQPITTSPEALALVEAYPWPGNVREMAYAVARAINNAFPRRRIEAADLDLPAPDPAEALADLANVQGKTWAQLEARTLAEVMRVNQGNRTAACRQLGIDRKRLLRMLEEYGLEKVGLEGEETEE